MNIATLDSYAGVVYQPLPSSATASTNIPEANPSVITQLSGSKWSCKNILKETAYKTMWMVGTAAFFSATSSFNEKTLPLNLFLWGVGGATGLCVDFCFSDRSYKERTWKNIELVILPWSLIQAGVRSVCYAGELSSNSNAIANWSSALFTASITQACCSLKLMRKLIPTPQDRLTISSNQA